MTAGRAGAPYAIKTAFYVKRLPPDTGGSLYFVTG